MSTEPSKFAHKVNIAESGVYFCQEYRWEILTGRMQIKKPLSQRDLNIVFEYYNKMMAKVESSCDVLFTDE